MHYSPSSTESDSPFELCFVTGNIKVCRGCRQKYEKPPIPPMNLCIRHKEWQEFVPSGSASTQVRFGNVYYHVNIPCILTRCPYFTSDMLVIPPGVAITSCSYRTSCTTYASLLALMTVLCASSLVYFDMYLFRIPLNLCCVSFIVFYFCCASLSCIIHAQYIIAL